MVDATVKAWAYRISLGREPHVLPRAQEEHSRAAVMTACPRVPFDAPASPDRRVAIKVLTAGCLAMFLGSGVAILYAAGVLFPAIAADTGWSRTEVAAALSPAALAIGLMCPVVGALTDRFGPRRILVPAATLYALALAAIPLMASTPLWFAIALTIAAGISAAITPVTYSYLIIGWMPDRRGLGMGLILASSGLGVAIVPAVIGVLLPYVGWRFAYVLLGVAALIAILPATICLVKDPPRAFATHRKGDAPDRPGISLAEALRLPAFWSLTLAFLFNGIVANAGSISLPLVATDYGIAPGAAAAIMVWVGLSMVLSRIVIGALLDRFSPIILSTIVFASPALGFVILLGDYGYGGFMAAAILFGVAIGTEGDAMGVILSRRFGVRHFGKIFGINFAAYAFSGGLGPWLLNVLRGQTESDSLAFVCMSVLSLLAMLLLAGNRTRTLVYR